MTGNRQMSSGAATSGTDEGHMEKVKSVPERTHSISRMAFGTEVRISPACVYRTLTNSMGKRNVCAKWIPHLLIYYQKSTSVFLASTHLQRWGIKTVYSSIASKRLRSHRSHYLTLD
jgi:hypothetical protein